MNKSSIESELEKEVIHQTMQVTTARVLLMNCLGNTRLRDSDLGKRIYKFLNGQNHGGNIEDHPQYAPQNITNDG